MKKEETLINWSVSDICGDLDDFINKIKFFKKDFKKSGYKKLRIDIEDKWGYYDEHDIDIVIYGTKEISKKKFIDKKKK
jgi:hypothetical protein